ncbi:hypothetical protein M5K25_023135 [Dendrobium thyrsiflorum]|uniref:Uncharacterized protein n=1 Tax=Dendrobium thyrsiflorum TaxID=117978 RepID=A0ABD0UEC7_DENTH
MGENSQQQLSTGKYMKNAGPGFLCFSSYTSYTPEGFRNLQFLHQTEQELGQSEEGKYSNSSSLRCTTNLTGFSCPATEIKNSTLKGRLAEIRFPFQTPTYCLITPSKPHKSSSGAFITPRIRLAPGKDFLPGFDLELAKATVDWLLSLGYLYPGTSKNPRGQIEDDYLGKTNNNFWVLRIGLANILNLMLYV